MDDPSGSDPIHTNEQVARIDAARCSGCGRCISACELRLFAFEIQNWKKVAVMQEAERCVGCGDCVARCAIGAVSLVDRPVPGGSA